MPEILVNQNYYTTLYYFILQETHGSILKLFLTFEILALQSVALHAMLKLTARDT